MGFTGLTITDAMDMHAVAIRGTELSVMHSLAAGNDLALLGHIKDQVGLVRTLGRREDAAAIARIQAAQRRVRVEPLPFDVIGSAEHRIIAQQIAERAITLVKDEGARLPLRPGTDARIVVITPEPVNLTPADTSASVQIELEETIRAYHPRTTGYQLPHRASEADAQALAEVVAADGADQVIVGTVNAYGHSGQTALVKGLVALGLRPIVVALRTPYDLLAFPLVETYVCAYSIRRPSIEAVARFLFGEIKAEGILPCTLPAQVR
jgi:beta-N-acetylhexosaminidase